MGSAKASQFKESTLLRPTGMGVSNPPAADFSPHVHLEAQSPVVG